MQYNALLLQLFTTYIVKTDGPIQKSMGMCNILVHVSVNSPLKMMNPYNCSYNSIH